MASPISRRLHSKQFKYSRYIDIPNSILVLIMLVTEKGLKMLNPLGFDWYTRDMDCLCYHIRWTNGNGIVLVYILAFCQGH